MKIRYQSAVELNRARHYVDALNAHFKRVASPGTVIELNGAKKATWGDLQPARMIGYPAVFHQAFKSIFIEGALNAERDGYDAFIIGTSIDPALREIRSLVDIPVISSTESAFLLGCTIADKIGIVTPTEEVARVVRANLEACGFGARLTAFETIQPSLADDALNAALAEPEILLQRFKDAVKRAMIKGAEVILPAEGILAEVIASNGISEIDGAQVLDPIGIAILFAEMRVHMRARLGLQTSRCGHYKKPPQAIIDALFT